MKIACNKISAKQENIDGYVFCIYFKFLSEDSSHEGYLEKVKKYFLQICMALRAANLFYNSRSWRDCSVQLQSSKKKICTIFHHQQLSLLSYSLSICPSNTRSRSQQPRCAGSGRKSVPAVCNAKEERCAPAPSKVRCFEVRECGSLCYRVHVGKNYYPKIKVQIYFFFKEYLFLLSW